MATARVTVTLPTHVVDDIDRQERNRSAFVLEAVRRELLRRRREELRRSLEAPHPETRKLAETGFAAWARGLPEEDADQLIDVKAGTSVRWVPKKGWVAARS
jgi:hypothetical protein